uniref:Peptidase S1 domain-containing protein n=1 Tax=Anopheles atroparvus TaxID=41427 RepID=A0AAG5CRB3_ANOAO
MFVITKTIIFFCIFVGVLSESEPFQPAKIRTPSKSVVQSSTGQQHTVARHDPIELPSTRGSTLNDFVHHLHRPSHQSNSTFSLSEVSPFLSMKPSTGIIQDEPQSMGFGPGAVGLGNVLFILANLTNRPLSDQSAASGTGSIISGGIGVVQETVNQVGSNIQQGFSSVFGANQGNEASPSNWATVRPIGNASSSSKPSFCPPNCTMVCGMAQKQAQHVRIVGGTDVTPVNRYPWIALMQYYGHNVGTGTLVNDRVVLTTASIVSRMVVFKQIKVILGAFNASSSTETTRKEFTVTKARVHPQYSADRPLHYNIAFLQLAVPVMITDSIMPICMPNNVDTFADTNGTLAGWGARSLDGEPWKTLQEVQIPLYSYDECRLAYPNATEDNLCGGVFDPAPKDQHKTSCEGDGGAGLMYPWKPNPSLMALVGITLHLPDVGCGRTNEPALFTKLYRYIPWLKSQATGCYCKS